MGLFSWMVRSAEVDRAHQTISALKTDKSKLKEELEELKLQKRLEGEEIKHMQRINEERMKQELENEKIKLNKKYQEDISKFKEEQRIELVNSLKEFHMKIETRFNSELQNLKETYKEIMARLPNVNLTLTKKLT